MESDHQVLAVQVIEAVKAGAGLVVANSNLDHTDRLISSLAMDPFRGTASVLWNAVTQVLSSDGVFDRQQGRGPSRRRQVPRPPGTTIWPTPRA